MATISPGYYKSLESKNEEAPSLETLMKICIALDVPLEFIVKDCEIELFEDFCNYRLKKSIKDSPKSKSLVCSALFNIYDFINNYEDIDNEENN